MENLPAFLFDDRACCPDRPQISTPFLLERRGERWACATNGRAMIAIRTTSTELRPAPELVMNDGARSLRDDLFAARGAPAPFAELSAWALNGVDADTVKVCRECKGTKVATCDDCKGQGDTECECSCGDVHDADCDTCDGKGKYDCECPDARSLPRVGRIIADGRSAFVDRALFGFVFAHLASEEGVEVIVRGDAEPASFIGNDWRILVMPYRPAPEDAEKAEVLELSADQAVQAD